MNYRSSALPIICLLALAPATFLPAERAASPATSTPPSTSTVPPATASSISKAPASAKATNPPATSPYTVVAGDSFTKLAEKFNTTRKALKALNPAAPDKLVAGQVIQVPASRKALAAAAKKARQARLAAQPIPDFDIPASTFASCPVPDQQDDSEPVVIIHGGVPPVAQLVSPQEMSADVTAQNKAALASQERLTANIAPPRLTLPSDAKLPSTPKSPAAPKPALAKAPPVTGSTATRIGPPAPSGLANNRPVPTPSATSRFSASLPKVPATLTGMNTPAYTPLNDWGFKFLRQARVLGDRGIDYDDEWRPPGERMSWTMDCSNTTRYLYKVTAGINLPRTASDQYYYLHLQGKAWDVPSGPTGWADVAFLQKNLRPGDLLFWENTYRPERQPPITHVMVFLGTNERGQWIMAGSQSSRGGEHNRRNGGPDIYVFRPSQPCGGYTTWMGMVHHQGRFCAFGRPLEADPTKLSVAANE